MKVSVAVIVFGLFLFASVASGEDQFVEEMESQKQQTTGEETEEAEEPAPEKLEYMKGSLCGYCSYCKFCDLCEQDCPCERGPTRPNCHMCKYCKFCYLCTSVCDTVCQPGGVIDKVSGSIISSLLPSYDADEVMEDIDSVKPWLVKKKDEL